MSHDWYLNTVNAVSISLFIDYQSISEALYRSLLYFPLLDSFTSQHFFFSSIGLRQTVQENTKYNLVIPLQKISILW